MFYLITQSTHSIYGYMVKDDSDSERANQLPLLRRLLFLISSKGSFIYTILQRAQYILQPLCTSCGARNSSKCP